MYACSIGIDGCPLSQLNRGRLLFVGLGLLSGGSEPPHEVWDVLSQAHDQLSPRIQRG